MQVDHKNDSITLTMDVNLIKFSVTYEGQLDAHVVKLNARVPYDIGRSANGLSINDPALLNRHCQLKVEPDGLYILSAPGSVQIGNKSVSRARLQADDIIKIGNTKIKILQINLAKRNFK